MNEKFAKAVALLTQLSKDMDELELECEFHCCTGYVKLYDEDADITLEYDDNTKTWNTV